MDYSKYRASRDLAWEILLRENVRELPISTSRLCRQMGIAVKYYIPADDSDGMCEIIDGRPVIFVNRDSYRPRQRFTVAHEMGHILLGHVGAAGLINREPSPEDNPIEQAANVFASRLLAPACVLWGCGVRSAEAIAALCDISQAAAEYRMERMTELYRRGKFLTSPLERKVYDQFRPYIEAHKLL